MKKILYTVLAAVMLVGCYKVDIYWSEHPEQGRLVLITDWSKRSPGVNIPPNYVVRVVDPPATEVFTETRVEYPNLFMPGTYTLYLHNNAKWIVMNGTIASVLMNTEEAMEPRTNDISGYDLVHEAETALFLTRGPEVIPIGICYECPGFQFWGSVTQTIEADRSYEVIVPMRQITRQLELDFTITEGDVSQLEEQFDAIFLGAAGSWNCETDQPVGQAIGMLIPLKRQGNKVTGMTRLLGVTGERMLLSFGFDFTDYAWLTLYVDVSHLFAEFNADDRTSAVVLKGDIQVQSGECSVSNLRIE